MKHLVLIYLGPFRRNIEKPGRIPGTKVATRRAFNSNECIFVMTTQEVGSDFKLLDFWTTTIWSAEDRITGLLFRGITIDPMTGKILTIVRTNQQDAYEAHYQALLTIKRRPISNWLAFMPNPMPPTETEDMRKIETGELVHGNLTFPQRLFDETFNNKH